jgi:hypothetical protein
MRKKYKTLEEMRAANAERQARWRKRQGWVGRRKARDAMRELRAERKSEFITNSPVSNKTPLRGDGMPVQEIYYADEEGVDRPYGERAGRRRVVTDVARASEPGVSGADTGGSREGGETENERATYAALEIFKEKRARRERAGVVVPELRF